MDKPQISIIIVNYNVKDLLVACLKSIYSTISPNLVVETIVIDNDSKDRSVEAVTNEFPQVIVIENKFNAGFSGANNQGMILAKGEFIFLLNPDTEIVGDALSQLMNYLAASDSCVIVAPQLLNSDSSIQTSVWKNYYVFDLITEAFYFHKYFNRFYYPVAKLKTTFEAKTLSGAALFFKKELVDNMGMLDENLFWMEDIDFCFRAQKYGSMVYLHTAQVIHHSGQSQKKNFKIAISNQLLSKLKYFKKHGSLFTVFLSNFACTVFICSRLIAFSLLFAHKQNKLKAEAYLFTLKRYFKYLFLNEKSIF